PSRERPVLLRPLDDAVEVLSQQVTPSNQIHRRTSNSLKVVIDASISLFEGQARIPSGLSCRPSRREGNVRPQELVDLARISDRWIPEIPAGDRRQWYRNFRVTNTTKVVSISIDLWHEMRKGRELRANHSRRSLNGPRIGHPWKRRELVPLN